VAYIRAVAQREFRQIFPWYGWVEHDPDDIWQSRLDTACAALVWERATGQPGRKPRPALDPQVNASSID